MNLTEEQKSKMLHASGLSRSKESTRNYYNCDANDPDWTDLVVKGLATGPHIVGLGLYPENVGNFFLTDLGMDIVYGIKRRMKK